MDYEVQDHDTLERIAASHDCTVGELIKLNKMGSRFVFPGQHILVPVPTSDDVFEQQQHAVTSNKSTNIHNTSRLSSGAESSEDGIRKGPGTAIPLLSDQRSSISSATSKINTDNIDTRTGVISNSIDVDSDCLQRFLKLKVKQLTETDGTVAGTLLVTPNCLMFDPDVTHPLVRENGSDMYGMVASMDDIMSVALYKDIGVLTGETLADNIHMYDPDHIRTSVDNDENRIDKVAENNQLEDKTNDVNDEQRLRSMSAPTEIQSNIDDNVGVVLSTADNLPSIAEEELAHVTDRPTDITISRRHNSDLTPESPTYRELDANNSQQEQEQPMHDSLPSLFHIGSERTRANSDLTPTTNTIPQPSTINSRISPNMARKSVARLGRTLSIRGSVTSGAQSMAQTAMSGTKTVAHGVVTHTRSAADTLQTGLQTGAKAAATGAKVAATGAKAAAEAVVAVPQNIVNMSTGLFAPDSGVMDVCDSLFATEDAQRSPTSMKRQQSLATLENLRQKTQQARDLVTAKQRDSIFLCATSADDMPELFKPVQEMINTTGEQQSPTSTQLPYYMCVRLNKRRKQHKKGLHSSSHSNDYSTDSPSYLFGNRLKRFAVPRDRAEAVYHFLLQWSPDKYGIEMMNNDMMIANESATTNCDDRGFLIVDTDDDDALGESSTPLFGSYLNREWEICTVEEMRRRLSLSEISLDDLPIPDGASTSQILDESMIRQILEILPPRAEGYPWTMIYNAEKHGFSLNTLYRKMSSWNEDMSPTLIIIRDTFDHIFGAITSTSIRPSEVFYGTGDACLLWRFVGGEERQLQSYQWTGANQFFIKASRDSLSIGAGGGHYGLWLDQDLNHGRSQRCETFDNDPLPGTDDEDFNVQFIEVFGFRMM